jgi:hypothetical protein
MKIIPTEKEKSDWSRCAQAAYRVGNNTVGHFMSGIASLEIGAATEDPLHETARLHYNAFLGRDYNDSPAFTLWALKAILHNREWSEYLLEPENVGYFIRMNREGKLYSPFRKDSKFDCLNYKIS